MGWVGPGGHGPESRPGRRGPSWEHSQCAAFRSRACPSAARTRTRTQWGQTCEVFPAAVDSSNLRRIAVVFIPALYDLWRRGDDGSSVFAKGILGLNGRLLRGNVMPGQGTSTGRGLRICPAPPEGFDPFAAGKVDLARHGLPLRPEPETQPDLAALWDRLADRYRGFEHLEPRPDTATAGRQATRNAAAPGSFPWIPRSRAATACSAPRRRRSPPCSLPGRCLTCGTVPIRTGLTPSGPSSVSASSTCTRKCPSTPRSTSLADCGRGSRHQPASQPRYVMSGSLCLDTKPPGTAHYFVANQTTAQTITFTLDPVSLRCRHRDGRLPRRWATPTRH